MNYKYETTVTIKTIIFSIIFVLFIVFSFYLVIKRPKLEKRIIHNQYQIKITYCDNRKPKIKEFFLDYFPYKHSIKNYQRGVPEFEGEFNVCDLEILNVDTYSERRIR